MRHNAVQQQVPLLDEVLQMAARELRRHRHGDLVQALAVQPCVHDAFAPLTRRRGRLVARLFTVIRNAGCTRGRGGRLPIICSLWTLRQLSQ